MRKLLPLLLLYFSQGLPFGFMITALPVMLRERGVSLQTIGFAGVLAVPWMAKAAWAPLVDRYGSTRFGRRKSWIVPMQAGLVATAFIAAQFVDRIEVLVGLIFFMNLFAATMDIAVDALAVSWLDEDELGPGNALQVVGYKLGMLTGGGLLVWATARIGWNGLFYAMGFLLLGVLVMSILMRERPSDAAPVPAEQVPFRELVARLRDAWRQPGAAALIVVVLTYKMGESIADAMWKPMLFDLGVKPSDVGLWNGTYGMVFSLAGSTLSGLLARRVSLVPALFWVSGFRALGVAALWWVSVIPQPSAASIIAVTCVEHFFAGAITTLLFALMMSHTDRTIGGTHYTLLASLEVWGKVPLAALSGFIAEGFGYPAVFATGTALCVAFAVLVGAVRPRLSA